MEQKMFRGDWPAKEAAPLRCKVYSDGGKPLVTNIAKEFPELTRRERREMARTRIKARLANEGL